MTQHAEFIKDLIITAITLAKRDNLTFVVYLLELALLATEQDSNYYQPPGSLSFVYHR